MANYYKQLLREMFGPDRETKDEIIKLTDRLVTFSPNTKWEDVKNLLEKAARMPSLIIDPEVIKSEIQYIMAKFDLTDIIRLVTVSENGDTHLENVLTADYLIDLLELVYEMRDLVGSCPIARNCRVTPLIMSNNLCISEHDGEKNTLYLLSPTYLNDHYEYTSIVGGDK